MAKTSTKEKILDAALQLFNAKGTDSITVRHIAAEIGISHGNLCYHYPTKEDVIYALYMQLVAGFNEKVEKLIGIEMSFIDTLESSRFAIALFYQYRFLMLDIVTIMRTDERIKTHYKALMQQRKSQFRIIFGKAEKGGFMRKEIYPGEFENLVVILTILGDSWISHSEIHFEGTEEAKIAYYNQVMFSAFSPYLTPEGWKEMLKMGGV